MPSVGQISGPASAGLGVALPLLGVSGPVGAAIAGAVGLIGLVDKIGQGRKTANKMTGNGGPQDILNKQLAAISGDQNSNPQEKAQATERAWTGFLQAANQFAATQGPRAAQVVQQAIYKTPALTNTVSSLLAPLGKTALDQSYTSNAAIQANSKVDTGGVPWGQIAMTGAGIAAPFAINALQGRSIGDITGSPGTMDASNPDWQGPLQSQGGTGIGGKILSGLSGVFGGGNGNNGSGPGNSGGGGSLFSRLFPTLVSSGTSLLGAHMTADAATNAANAQVAGSEQAAQTLANAGKYATDAQTGALDKTLAFNRDVLDQQQKNLQPWLDAGTGALRSIQDITNSPGFSWNQTFTPPTPEEAMKDPGIQFDLQQGQNALQAYERANGSLLSGKAVKDINQFAQGVASTGYQNVYNRDLNTYNTNYGTFANERTAKLNPQLSLAGLGQLGTGQLNSDLSSAANLNTGAQMGAANSIGNISMGTGSGIANEQTGAANARASGYVARGNAYGGAATSIGNNILNTATIQQILSRLGVPGNA